MSIYNFFYHSLPPEGELSLEELHFVVREVWLARLDPEIEAERAARRKGRPKSTKEQKLEEQRLRESEVYRTGMGECGQRILNARGLNMLSRGHRSHSAYEREAVPPMGPEGGGVRAAAPLHPYIKRVSGNHRTLALWSASSPEAREQRGTERSRHSGGVHGHRRSSIASRASNKIFVHNTDDGCHMMLSLRLSLPCLHMPGKFVRIIDRLDSVTDIFQINVSIYFHTRSVYHLQLLPKLLLIMYPISPEVEERQPLVQRSLWRGHLSSRSRPPRTARLPVLAC